jgi:hypothetical protein
MPRIFGFTQFLRNITGGYTGGYAGMKEELTPCGMGTEMWTEQLQEIMIQGRKCPLFLQDILL